MSLNDLTLGGDDDCYCVDGKDNLRKKTNTIFDRVFGAKKALCQPLHMNVGLGLQLFFSVSQDDVILIVVRIRLVFPFSCHVHVDGDSDGEVVFNHYISAVEVEILR